MNKSPFQEMAIAAREVAIEHDEWCECDDCHTLYLIAKEAMEAHSQTL